RNVTGVQTCALPICTILHKDNQVDTETSEVIKKLRNLGYKVFLATGRAHDEIRYLVPENFEVDGIISSNGTLGVVKEETIFKHRSEERRVGKEGRAR